VPGLGVLYLLRRVPADEAVVPTRNGQADGAVRPPAERIPLPPAFWRTLGILLLFALGNSTDAFLLLRLSEAGVAVAAIPLLWALLHVVKAGSAVLGGRVADRVARPRLIALGWLLYAGIYAGFAGAGSPSVLVGLFLAYGVYYGLTEGAEKALVADLSVAERRGTAFGWYHGALGAGALLSSVVFGFVWEAFGAASAFALGATLAVAASVLMLGAGPAVGERPGSLG
jgi:predicted MFS family arabinose efflux permease